jgi:retinol dehydrogenase 12
MRKLDVSHALDLPSDIQNSGVMHPPVEQMTTDGYDMQFGTNVLGELWVGISVYLHASDTIVRIGHWFFTESLLPALIAGAKTSPDGFARVVTTSSSGAHLADGIHWETFREHPNRLKVGSNMLYFQSKLVRIHTVFSCLHGY